MANTFTFASLTLTDANIFGGINYTVDLNTGEEFSIGNTASACVSFVTDTQLPLYTKDQTDGTFVWDVDGVNRGRFYITEVKKVDTGYNVTAYDAMMLLETNVSALGLSLPVTVSAAASAIAAFIGCTISGTIINGSMTADSLGDTVTCRQLLGWAAEASGCSVKINGSDELCFMYYADSGITITASDYKDKGLEVADYTCAAIDNVTVLDMAGMTCATAGSGTNSLFIQGNPFMYEATNTEAAAVLAVVGGFVYAPLACDMFEDNGLEVGVAAVFGTATTLVMHYEESENGVIVSSVGSDSRAELNKSLDIIVNEAMSVASDAQQTAQELNLHFWYTASGSEAGAHIAEVDKPTFETNPTGGNLLSSSNGIAVRDGLTELATFGASGAVIGQATNGKSRTEVSASGMQVVQRENDNDIEIANLGYGSGNAQGGGVADAPYYTLGVRRSGSAVGNYSVAEGLRAEASGWCSHAEGQDTLASGDWSHAEGIDCIASGGCSHAEGERAEATATNSYARGDWAIASSDNQTALGKFNVADANDTYAVIIGNGTSNSARSNALTVDWQGNVEMALDTTAVSGTDYELYTAINSLGWASDVIV